MRTTVSVAGCTRSSARCSRPACARLSCTSRRPSAHSSLARSSSRACGPSGSRHRATSGRSEMCSSPSSASTWPLIGASGCDLRQRSSVVLTCHMTLACAAPVPNDVHASRNASNTRSRSSAHTQPRICRRSHRNMSSNAITWPPAAPALSHSASIVSRSTAASTRAAGKHTSASGASAANRARALIGGTAPARSSQPNNSGNASAACVLASADHVARPSCVTARRCGSGSPISSVRATKLGSCVRLSVTAATPAGAAAPSLVNAQCCTAAAARASGPNTRRTASSPSCASWTIADAALALTDSSRCCRDSAPMQRASESSSGISGAPRSP
eukprot:Unigene17143_Nuclearia_a/m.50382 Unigene17143_Nuclearia_a/g.50382  ORF Unigene17143_Nuclearia_a/g.50382 Unigene17143_Nuclearia_a/m.50382 type:complete len:331 (-) Unigene17143_Nuclearia_a:1011-2003(-)